MSGPVLTFEHVGKTYRPPLSRPWDRPAPALVDVSFAVQPGSSVGLIGPNRAGKTTVLKLLLSVCRPSRGRITRFGRPISDRGVLSRIGFMHEKQALPGYLTATELLHFHGAMSGLAAAALRRRVPELIARVGLHGRHREPVGRFSKGMIQRLVFAQMLLGEPDLLVLDEPSGGLDLEGVDLVHQELRRHRDAGGTAILVSHDLHEVQRLCDTLLVLDGGHLAYAGTVERFVGAADGLEDAMRVFRRRAAPEPAEDPPTSLLDSPDTELVGHVRAGGAWDQARAEAMP